ncbi:DUF881 domain-containing protein [Candidatus Formimonas warabiya]|uniref:DUF881 domain-containing protein n=1 Tax=Formimonas warabiya TaxID=1761012 RepID=A0A3G1KRY4_FORW1|nr:DUF881 domain-containing protein [Candidatus Formimonas warabiya]ATW25252.1 hypothetical protein DCMF_11170 [Candidatus Formimonas warabiya]
MSNWKKYLPITIACILTGLLLASALRTQTAVQNTDKTSKNNTLIDIINNLESETKVLEETISSLRDQIEVIQKKDSSEGILVSVQNQVQQLRLQAGHTSVSGPGIIVVLDDNTAGAEAAKTNSPDLYDPEDYIVHDKNLLYLVSALRGQAEAIAINSQRLVATSDIRCVGTVIMVNSSRLAPPYQIKVIGDPRLLEAAVLNSDEYIYLKGKDMPITITKTDNIELPDFKGSNTINFAQPLKDGEGD